MGNITDSGFQEVHNLGSPLNTKYDDFGVIVDKDMKRGYFSSNRASGKGGDDIYAFDMVKKEILPVKPETLIVEELPTIVAVSKYEEPVIVPSPKNEMPDLAALNKTVANLSIYFDLDKSNIRPDAQIGLEKIVKILNDYPTMILELKSFTDCRATERYNQNLSERRANESLRYLKDRITHPERISGKGLGEKSLANDCDCEDKVVSQCAEPQHQKNRRTEFVIISK